MARVTHVRRAQQRYRTVPVIDPETGQQKITPVMKKDGTPKLTKTGRPVVMRVTTEDRSQPLPNRKCGKCGNEIKVGDPYKHVTVKSTYGGTTYVRCDTCPSWQPWELSSSLSARIQQIQSEYAIEVDETTEVSDIEEALSSAADAIRELSEEKRDSAQNIEDGFGHATYQSDELNEIADALESWADEVEGADIPDKPEEPDEPGEEPEDPDSDEWDEWDSQREQYESYESDLASWIDDATSAANDVLDNSPY